MVSKRLENKSAWSSSYSPGLVNPTSCLQRYNELQRLLESKVISESDEVEDIVSKNRNPLTVESQGKTCAAKSLLHQCKIEDLTGTAEAFVLDLTSQL